MGFDHVQRRRVVGINELGCEVEKDVSFANAHFFGPEEVNGYAGNVESPFVPRPINIFDGNLDVAFKTPSADEQGGADLKLNCHSRMPVCWKLENFTR